MTPSRRPAGITVLLLMLASVFPLAAQEDLSRYPPDIRRIKERGTLLVGMYTNDVVPFMFHDAQGNFIGHEVQLAKDMAAALGVKVAFDRSPQTFNEIVDLVAAERVDLAISLISRTLIRFFGDETEVIIPVNLTRNIASVLILVHRNHRI